MRSLQVIPVALLWVFHSCLCQYQPNWESLDSRPLPAWYDQEKIGIFMHWGIYAVPSFGGETVWFWYYLENNTPGYAEFIENNYGGSFTYADFAALWKTDMFDANEWADLFKAAGARYVVLTSKHHDGFALWPSKVSWNWNSMDVGPKRDLVGEFAKAIRNRTDIHFGLYHSMFEWFHPLYLKDKESQWKTQSYVAAKAMPELYEIITQYQPEVLWSDGAWEAPDTYWNSTQFLAWLYNESPVRDTIATNDRWGDNCECKHGGFYNCMDRFNPGTLQKHKWENAMTLDRNSWGYRRASRSGDYLSMEEILKTMAETISCGGNFLMDVGPTADGRIPPILEERLRQFGSWINVNGEAIYSSKAWTHQNDTITTGVWYTSNNKIVYAIVLNWPSTGHLQLGAPKPSGSTTAKMVGYKGAALKWSPLAGGGMDIIFPTLTSPADLPCQWAWVIKLEYLS